MMSAVDDLLKLLTDRVGDKKDSKIFTPPKIAREMVELIPDDAWNEKTTFIDPICKSGIFLYEIYLKLMKKLETVDGLEDPYTRSEHILTKQIFGIAVDQTCLAISNRILYGYQRENSNIITIDEYNTVMTNTDKRFLNNILKEKFGIMKFDVVIGNPPYNRGGP